jgi:hypothetical protein
MSDKWNRGGGAGAVGGGYFLGFVGAVIYYLQNAHTFLAGIWGIIQAIFWPAFLVYHLFSFLKI